MTLNKFIVHQEKAIVANFKMRNTSVCSTTRMKQIKAQRRKTIRCFIQYLRLATNPATSELVAQRIKFAIG